jgi:hypothetical protein
VPKHKIDNFLSPIISPVEYQIAELIRLILSGDNTENENARFQGISAILFNNESKSLKIVEVKTTSNGRNSFITGFYQKYKSAHGKAPDYWVLYYQDKIETQNDKFFIFTYEEIALEQAKRNKSDHEIWDKRSELHATGVDNILIKDISPYLNRWDKFKI